MKEPAEAEDPAANAPSEELNDHPRSDQHQRCTFKNKKLYRGNTEALGWALDGVANFAATIAPAAFLSVAIINLAKREAGCDTEIPPGEVKAPECNERVYGLRPTSLWTTYGTVVGLISACCLPLVGAVVDYTSHRKRLGFWTALMQIVLLSALTFISESNWFIMLILQVFNAFFGWVHTLTAFAYLPELTDDPGLLMSWTANFHILQYVSLILFLALMLVLIRALGFNGDDVLLDDVPAARLANGSVLAIIIPFYLWTWTSLMEPRDAFHKLPEGSSLWTIGFVKVTKTSKLLFTKYRALMWFFVDVCLAEACQQSIATIGLTYMTDTMLMKSSETGIAILLLFFFGIVGSSIAKYSVSYMNPIRSNMICQTFTAINIGIAALIMTGPGQQMRAYFMAACWGIGAGWKNVVERFITCEIIPKGQDAELMGFYLFSSQILIWLPTLVFTLMNEAGISQRVGLLTLIVFFLGGMCALCMMGSYDEAMQLAKTESDKSENDDFDDHENKKNAQRPPSLSKKSLEE